MAVYWIKKTPGNEVTPEKVSHRQPPCILSAPFTVAFTKITENVEQVISCKESTEKVAMGRLSAYLLALRPWSFQISLEPVALGAALAYRLGIGFSLYAFLASAVTALCVHAAGNVVNSYFDYAKGVDATSVLSKDDLVRLGAFLYAFGLFTFFLQYTSSTNGKQLALVFFGGMSSSFLYTGGPGLKYIGLGDVLVMVTFGPLCVMYSFLSQSGSFMPMVLTYAIPLALNTEAILHANNLRDRESDSKAGVVTLAVAAGEHLSHVLYALLLFVPYIGFAVVSLTHGSFWMMLPLITLPTAFHLEKECRLREHFELDKNTARLNAYFSVFYLVAIVMTKKLPGFY